MSSKNKSKRLSNLTKVPMIAAVDHRHFLDKDGNDTRLESLSRNQRRKLAAKGRKIGLEYNKILRRISRSGAGYPIDKLLRELSIEYTHRYATSGVFNQPISFNYFEPFCKIELIKNSVAPFAEPAFEYVHLFSIVDYFDYTTSIDGAGFTLAQLKDLPEGKVFHFTTNGDIGEFTFLTADGREFVVSGFSMIRHENSLHWYGVGGEVLSEQEWEAQMSDQREIEIGQIPKDKRPFLSQAVERDGKTLGAPVALEGTKTAVRTVIAGEIDLNSCKHLGRCYMTERENSFLIMCDDPDVFAEIADPIDRMEKINSMRDRIEGAAVMWNLAEAMFQLPAYFAFKINIKKSIAVASGRQIERAAKRGRGVGVQFRNVSAIDYVDKETPTVRAYTPPHYQMETDGHWRRLKPDSFGHRPDGSQVRGKTWVKSKNEWRERPDTPRTIYVKSSVATAKIKEKEYIEMANLNDSDSTNREAASLDKQTARGVLYVLRCVAMKNGVYKVGWTSGTADERAKALSSATGVPSSFVVVDYWQHLDPYALETGVHALLDPYRLDDGREFFQADYKIIKNIIELEIERANSKLS